VERLTELCRREHETRREERGSADSGALCTSSLTTPWGGCIISPMVKKKQTAPVAGTEYLDPAEQKALADRLARLEGHVRAIRQMVVDRRCADEILLQVAAVKAAMNRFAALMVQQEMTDCVQSCMPGEDDERLEKVLKVVGTLLKQT